MKRFLKEIEISGILLMFIGCVMKRFMDIQAGIIACFIGILLWLIVVVYKAFHWQEYSRDNKQNIIMMLVVILLLFGMILLR